MSVPNQEGGWSASNDCAFGSVVVIPSGLEPETVCLEGRCSIQLSYGTRCGRFRGAKFGRESGPAKWGCNLSEARVVGLVYFPKTDT